MQVDHLFRISLSSGKDKKRLNAALPAGVTERDVALFTRSQEKAQSFLSHENKVSDAVWRMTCVLGCVMCDV